MARPRNCGKCNKPKRPKGNKFKGLDGYCNCGRPTVMTPDVLAKLEDGFLIGLNNRKACAYAKISVFALRDYEKVNPEFTKRKEELRLMPDIKALQTVVKSLDSAQHAWRWLEKKDKDFMPTSKVEHGGSVEVADLTVEMSKEEKEAVVLLRAARRKRIEDKSKELE